MRTRQVFSSAILALVVSAGSIVAADQLYVGVERAEVLSEPDAVFGEVIKRVDRGQPVDGKLAEWEEGRQRNTYMRVSLPDGSSGYLQASALVDQAPADSQSELRASSGAEGAGAAARGLTSEIEQGLSADDPEFAKNIREVDRNERSVNRALRGAKSGNYADADPNALRREIRSFMKEGGLKHAE